MLLLFHIIIALGSLAQSAYVFFSPSKAKLNFSYSLVALTLASGTFLVLSKPVHIMQTCTTGLFYLAVVFSGILVGRRKLATELTSTKTD